MGYLWLNLKVTISIGGSWTWASLENLLPVYIRESETSSTTFPNKLGNKLETDTWNIKIYINKDNYCCNTKSSKNLYLILTHEPFSEILIILPMELNRN